VIPPTVFELDGNATASTQVGGQSFMRRVEYCPSILPEASVNYHDCWPAAASATRSVHSQELLLRQSCAIINPFAQVAHATRARDYPSNRCHAEGGSSRRHHAVALLTLGKILCEVKFTW
jgi:hypothetical protein